MSRLFLIVTLLCAGRAGSPTRPGQGGFGEPFELRAGASVGLAEGLALVFDRVASDSRCPIDAICITTRPEDYVATFVVARR